MICENKLREIVQALEPKPPHVMKPFNNSETLQCPWLHRTLERYKERDDQKIDIKSVLLLQDWDVKPQPLQEAVEYLKKCEDCECSRKDNTIRNLFSRNRKWREKIVSGEVLVTNAAWGIRPGSTNESPGKICGYLGAAIHKKSFLTWGHLIHKIQENNIDGKDQFRLFVAGEWARFDNIGFTDKVTVEDYMKKWCLWVKKHRGKVSESDVTKLSNYNWGGNVVFLRHPCIWHTTTNYESDPFFEQLLPIDALCSDLSPNSVPEIPSIIG